MSTLRSVTTSRDGQQAELYDEWEEEACHTGELLLVTLTVPELWATRIAATTATLSEEFPELPPVQFAPHISLCQRFRPAVLSSAHVPGTPTRSGGTDAAPIAVKAVIGRILDGISAPIVRTGDVRCFAAADGGFEVIYLGVEAEWLQEINRRLVLETAPFRAVCDHSFGNRDFDLSGFKPHITLLLTRGLPADLRLHNAIAARAAVLWSMAKPQWGSFRATEIVLSATDEGAWNDSTPPRSRTIASWNLGTSAYLGNSPHPGTSPRPLSIACGQ